MNDSYKSKSIGGKHINMNFVEIFRQNAKEYGCSKEEIKYIEDLLPLSNNHLIFTFEQFKAFCKYWSKYNGECPGLWNFSVHPKNHGFNLEGNAYMSLIGISPSFHLYKPSFGPGFIDDLADCWKQFKNNHCKLVLLSDGRQGSHTTFFNTMGASEIRGFIGGGRSYHEPSARPMISLEEIHEQYGGRCTYNKSEKILVVKTNY